MFFLLFRRHAAFTFVGEELLVHLYSMVYTICKGSIICLHWYVRSILRFPLNYSKPRELSYTICVSLHNALQSSPHFELLSCKTDASSELAYEFLGYFSSCSLHMDSRGGYQRTGGLKWGTWESLWDSHLLTYSQTFSLNWTNWRQEAIKGWVRSMVVSNWAALGQIEFYGTDRPADLDLRGTLK